MSETTNTGDQDIEALGRVIANLQITIEEQEQAIAYDIEEINRLETCLGEITTYLSECYIASPKVRDAFPNSNEAMAEGAQKWRMAYLRAIVDKLEEVAK